MLPFRRDIDISPKCQQCHTEKFTYRQQCQCPNANRFAAENRFFKNAPICQKPYWNKFGCFLTKMWPSLSRHTSYHHTIEDASYHQQPACRGLNDRGQFPAHCRGPSPQREFSKTTAFCVVAPTPSSPRRSDPGCWQPFPRPLPFRFNMTQGEKNGKHGETPSLQQSSSRRREVNLR